LKNNTKKIYSTLVLGNSESILFPQQRYVIVVAQLISSSFNCEIFSISQQPKRFRKIPAQQIFLVVHG